jgi:glutathione S-transferase
MLTVYGRRNSSNSAKVFWLLDALNQAYDLVPTGMGFGATDTAQFRAMNPFGKVPVLRDGDLIAWESNAILRYLASQYGPTPLWPNNLAERARIDRWMDWASISFTPPLTRLRKARKAGKTEDRDLPAVHDAIVALERRLGEAAYLAGDALTLADIVIAASVHRWHALPEAEGKNPNLAAYLARLGEDAGFRRHVQDHLS